MWTRTFDRLLNEMLYAEIQANEAEAKMFKRLSAQVKNDRAN
jgi:hypothetical protein